MFNSLGEVVIKGILFKGELHVGITYLTLLPSPVAFCKTHLMVTFPMLWPWTLTDFL